MVNSGSMCNADDESAHKAQKSHEVATRGFFYSVLARWFNPYISVQPFAALTRREQEIPHLYRWWDELR